MLFPLVILLSGSIILFACDTGSKYNNYEMVDGVLLMSSETLKKSLASRCEWDGDRDNMEFTVPDEYDGYKVICLGAKGNPGFSGKPWPFRVYLPYEVDGLNNLGLYDFVPDDCNSDNTTDLNFTVNIGKYVSEIEKIKKTALYAFGDNGEDGNDIEVYYYINIYYNVDAQNETFYSQNGDIYYKSNDKMVSYSR